jgi:hypothetical protein
MENKMIRRTAFRAAVNNLLTPAYTMRKVELWDGVRYMVVKCSGVNANGFDTHSVVMTATLTDDGTLTVTGTDKLQNRMRRAYRDAKLATIPCKCSRPSRTVVRGVFMCFECWEDGYTDSIVVGCS